MATVENAEVVFEVALARRLYEAHAGEGADWQGVPEPERARWRSSARAGLAMVGDVGDECLELARGLVSAGTPVRIERGEYEGRGAGELVCARADYHMAFGRSAGEALYELRAELLRAAGETLRKGARAAEMIRRVVASKRGAANDGLPSDAGSGGRRANGARALPSDPNGGALVPGERVAPGGGGENGRSCQAHR